MIKFWEWLKNNPIRSMFLVPILLVAGISISHVVSWYDIANPLSWAIYLSIAIEVGAMTALIAATNKIKGGVWFMFGIVTFIQMIGNIFFSYKEIDENGELFKSWVELTGPIWESLGSDITDLASMKRWLAFLEGGLLPVISLTSLHFFVKYDDGDTLQVTPQVEENTEKKNFDKVEESREEVTSPKIIEEELYEEPTALDFTPYENNDLNESYFEENRFFVDESIEKTLNSDVEELTTTTTTQNQIIRRTPIPDGYIIGKNYTTTTTTEQNSRILKYTKES
jgi:hypothetical protein